MSGFEPKLPLDVRSMQTVARDQIMGCIDAWLVDWEASRTVAHAGKVTREFLHKQSGRGLRSVMVILGGGGGGRIAGGAATQWIPIWGWFVVIPGVLGDRATVASNVTGEAVRLVTATPWLDLTAASSAGTMRFTGSPASVFAGGEIAVRNDGAQFVVAGAGVIPAAGFIDLPVTAVAEGSFSNTGPGAKLTLTTPPPGVDAVGTVDGTGLVLGADESAFSKTPIAESIQVVPAYSDKDEALGLSSWLIRWRQEICLGTAQRAKSPAPDVLTTVLGTSTIESEPNDGEFTQLVE